MIGKQRCGTLLLTSAIVGVMVFGFVGTANAKDPTYQFDISAESLSQALTDFSQASSQQIIYSEDLVRGRKTSGLHGRYTAAQALKTLISGTDLKVETNSSGVLMVRSKKAQAASNEAAKVGASEVEMVVVTGTHIPNAETASPVTVLNRDAIETSGYSTVASVIQSLPQNFSGGMNYTAIGAAGSSNIYAFMGGSSANLRGLGSESTLTLIDGHRVATDGGGNAVDISTIPTVAVSRIEVLTDGASAIYGSDAVAGVVNIILRKDFDGAESSYRIGTATNGGATLQKFDQSLGKTWDTGNVFVAYENYHQARLMSTQRSFSTGALSPTYLLPSLNKNSVLGSFNQEISSSVSAFVDAAYTSEESYNANTTDYYGTLYGIYYARKDHQYSVNGGLHLSLPYNWNATVSGTLSIDDLNFTEGYFEPFSLASPTPLKNKLVSGDFSAEGALISLPTGDVALAVGAGYRKETFSGTYGGPVVGNRSVSYGYAELHIPLVKASSTRIGLEKLEFSAAGRYENYSDFGATGNPKLGVLYYPIADLKIRGTWGTAFRAPSMIQLYGPTYISIYPEARFGGGVPGSVVLFQQGSPPSLNPETSTFFTAGADYSPSWLPNLKTSVTYFNISYRDRLTYPFSTLTNILGNPADDPFVTYNPSAAQQGQVFAVPGAKIYNGVGTYSPSQVSAIIDNRYVNAARQNAHGIDFSADYTFATNGGSVTLSGTGSWLHLTQKDLPVSASRTLSGTIFYPPKFKARLGVSWEQGAWTIAGFANYLSGEIDNSVYKVGTGLSDIHVSSWTTIDVFASYKISSSAFPLKGLKLALSAQNLFDQDPPYVAASSTGSASTGYTGLGYDTTNASALGRFVSLTVTKEW